MRPKILLFAGIGIALVLAWLYFRQPRQSNTPPESLVKNAQPVPAVSVSNASAVSQNTSNSPQVMASSPANQMPVVYDRKKTNEIRQYMESQNKPIEFYGQVIDQDGNSLAGVSINGEALHVKVVVPAPWGDKDEIVPITKETDTGGRFEIRGISGRAVELESIQKNGYEVEPVRRVWKTSEGTFENPVVFKMWSTNIHEPLITREKRFHIAIDGQPYFINLTEGTISQSSEGDLKVWVKFPAETNAEQPNNWLAEIDAVNGGLLEEHDPYSSMYLAPESSYTQTFQIARQLVRKNQRGMTGQHRFYVALKNGKEYGWFSVELFAPYNDEIPGLVDIKYAVNPSGSRILKP